MKPKDDERFIPRQVIADYTRKDEFSYKHCHTCHYMKTTHALMKFTHSYLLRNKVLNNAAQVEC